MYIRAGKDVRDKQVLRNLIATIILRLDGDYDKKTVNETARYYFGGSLITITRKEISSIISETLDCFQQNNIVECNFEKFQTV